MYYIGIDAGGTKTTAAIVDKKQNILFEYTTGQGNVTVHFLEAKHNIVEAIHQCLLNSYGRSCQAIVLGVAGIGSGDKKKRLQSALEEIFSLPTLVINDAELAYFANFKNNNGILSIAGTGSVFIGKNHSHFKMIGGWGHLLGDEGSSYDIGIKSLRILARKLETNGIHSTFTEALANQYGIYNSSQLKHFVYSSDKSAIAGISLFVYQLAKRHDKEAFQLIKEAGEILSNQTIRLIKLLQLTNPIHVKCKGSLFEKNEILFKSYKESLQHYDKDIQIQIGKNAAVTGAPFVLKNK
ncbi:BadF/BadG/BcrA/BcrD ATPase family protein [Caldifermentibacillus hisashii]|uniref:BadF/BadG/BcrA/BcrD ATPase family protein n=1 Tax=Caldifermentibacillus hisashii TaxID=996558 RepID=A0ABU9K230_9BACI|nr:BadF/BadG/BcrA/BcrD ATPase family protein [Caldibacillus thermoamylovorans]MCM3054688.1 hypothetical protein [Caldibacillus thermoamylovorans]